MMRYEPTQPLNSAGTAALGQLRTAVVSTGLTLLMLSTSAVMAEESTPQDVPSRSAPVPQPPAVLAAKTLPPATGCLKDTCCTHQQDICQLEGEIRRRFPGSLVEVYHSSKGLLMLDGTVKRPDDVRGIVRMAEESNPKVINRIRVGRVPTIVLPVTLLEVPTAELDQLKIESADDASRRGQANEAKVSRRETMKFVVLDTNGHELVERLKKIAGAKVLAEPTVVTVSGRPASFNIGGEFPLLVAMSDGKNVSIEYKKFGTQLDYVPIMLSNGNLRLEFRIRVSELDLQRSVEIDGMNVPGLRVRELDTGLELTPGQTLFLRGLDQTDRDEENEKAASTSLVLVLQPEVRKAVAKADSPAKRR